MLAVKVIAAILGLVGLAGCILPVIPGPPFSWVGLLLLYFWGDEPMSLRLLIIWLIITVVVTVLDYLVPPYFTKITGGSRASSRGALVGLFVRLIFFPPLVGMIAGAFIGALVAELINGNRMGQSLKAALGSFLGFIFGTFLKIVASVIMMVYIVKFL